MLCPDIVMVEVTSFVHGQRYHFFCAWSQAEFSNHNAFPTAKDRLNGTAGPVQVNIQVIQYFSRDAFALAYKAQQKVLCPDVVVLETLGFFLGKMQGFSGSLSKFVKTINLRHPSPLSEGVNKANKTYNTRQEDQQTNEVVFPRHTFIPFISPTLNVLP